MMFTAGEDVAKLGLGVTDWTYPLMIDRLTPGGWGEDVGIKPGDEIVLINTTMMSEVEDFKGEVLPMIASERPLDIQIKRDPDKTAKYAAKA